MSTYQIDAENELYYNFFAPTSPKGVTFVFFNALTSDTQFWDDRISPELRKDGHGTLTFNYRGQLHSSFSAELSLDQDLIVNDAMRLLQELQPPNPLFVGLSIGGLFAANVFLQGIRADALVLVNTLRKNSARLEWIGDALVRTASIGGLELFRDLFLPLLMNEQWLRDNRSSFLLEREYMPLPKNSGHYKLLAEAGKKSSWEVEYGKIDVPCLVMTGLQDHVFYEEEHVNALSRQIPRVTRHDFPDSGHLLPAEIPDVFTDQLLSFAQEVS